MFTGKLKAVNEPCAAGGTCRHCKISVHYGAVCYQPLENEVLFAFQPLTVSCYVILGCFLTFLIIIFTPQSEILHWAPGRWQLMVNLCIFHSLIMVPIVVDVSPTLLMMVSQPIPALCRSTMLSLSSFDISLVLLMVLLRLEWKILIPRAGELYTHDELRSRVLVIILMCRAVCQMYG